MDSREAALRPSATGYGSWQPCAVTDRFSSSVQAASRRPETHVMWKTTTTAGPSYPRDKLPLLEDLHAGALAAVSSESALLRHQGPDAGLAATFFPHLLL